MSKGLSRNGLREAVASQDPETIVVRAGVRDRRPRGDGVQVVSYDIGEDERDEGGGVGETGEAPSLDSGEVFPDRVDLVD